MKRCPQCGRGYNDDSMSFCLDDRDWVMHSLKSDAFMNSLRDDPRFKDLLKRINLPE